MALQQGLVNELNSIIFSSKKISSFFSFVNFGSGNFNIILNIEGANETGEPLCSGIVDKFINTPCDNIFALENLRNATNESYP
jgi:hypothetical protein